MTYGDPVALGGCSGLAAARRVLLVFGAVAVGTFTVNMQVVENTPCVTDVLQGVPKGIEGQKGLRSNAGQDRFGHRKGCDPVFEWPLAGPQVSQAFGETG